MEVGYQQALEALDQTDGDVVAALVLLEERTGGGLRKLQREIEEGVKRGLSGEQIETIRWKLQGQVVKEAPVALVGAAAVVVGVLALLVTNSSIEMEYAQAEAEPAKATE